MLDSLITLSTLIFLELILGIDNIVFISIAVSKTKNSATIRYIGLGLALIFRILMLFSISLLLSFAQPIILQFSVRDIILFAGGLFLLFKSLSEIQLDLGYKAHVVKPGKKLNVILQIAFIDLVFSLDSLLAALGLTNNILLIAIAFTITIIFMATASYKVTKYIEKFPELKTLALAFIIVIGVMLILDGLHIKVEKSYVYFAFFFSIGVEALNMLRRFKCKTC